MTTKADDTHNPLPADQPLALRLSEGLGLEPELAGQPRMMAIIDGAPDDETGHWYSPAAVREMLVAERDKHADALRCALEALDYCIEDSAELLNERTVQWGSWRKDRQAAMAATLERHRAVAERLREMLMT